jgi:hypothetical protein
LGDFDVGKIPSMKEAVSVVTAEALTRIEDAQKEDIVKKQEIIRDVCLGVVGKLQALWDKIALDEADEKTLRKYSGWFVAPLAEIMDLARKANVDVYEMRYGKKLQINKMDMKFEDFVKMKRAEIEKRPENQVIDVTEVKSEK